MSLNLPPRARAVLRLTAAIRVAHKGILRAAEACVGQGGISHPEMTILKCIEAFGDELTVPEMALIRKTKRQSIQPHVDDLVNRGLVKLVDNPKHRTSRLVRPTAAGEAVRDAIDKVSAESLCRVAEVFESGELDVACRVVERLVRRIDEIHPPK